MIKAMRTAASGMSAQQMNVDVIANNLANVNTSGYKRSKIEFQDILYQNLRSAGAESAAGSQVPISLEVGYGTRPSATQRNFSMGSLQLSGNPLDLAIEGNGFYQVLLPDGTTGYTRDGSFKMSADGQIVTSDGFFLEPGVTIPSDATDISVSADGLVSVLIPGEADPQELGQIELAKFINPAGLQAIGHNLYTISGASGDPILGNPSLDGFGRLNQGYLEMSNVEIVEEMVNMITAQRAYEINSKAIQTSEEMTQVANNLKR
ncbi:MAG: flagellar basal-body rod protein FlgG [candidate division Zixibacteria bacterium]|nr:flagellar basal-body rod protein FlgG [candidate division Zixibacteria bacterium]